VENEESKNDSSNKIQKVRLRISKLNQSKKFSTPVDNFSESSVSSEVQEEIIPQRNKNVQNFG
jgi:hypothetical protein